MDSLSNCANAGGIFYVGFMCGAIVGAICVLIVVLRKRGKKGDHDEG